MPLPCPDKPSQLALFLDFDGTLVEIAERPDRVHVDTRAAHIIYTLHRRLGGAVAIVTGRDIAAIDFYLSPLRLPIAGVHGSTRRDVHGNVFTFVDDGNLAAITKERTKALLARHSGLILEFKHGSAALHYRAHPELQDECTRVMQSVADDIADAVLKRGKMVVEARIGPGNKGTAIAEFLKESPFLGRLPAFAGDDITDEDAFKVVNELGGLTIKVGPGPTCAAWTVETPQDLLRWLAQIAEQLNDDSPIAGNRADGGV